MQISAGREQNYSNWQPKNSAQAATSGLHPWQNCQSQRRISRQL